MRGGDEVVLFKQLVESDPAKTGFEPARLTYRATNDFFIDLKTLAVWRYRGHRRAPSRNRGHIAS